jgi:hypothetical protein
VVVDRDRQPLGVISFDHWQAAARRAGGMEVMRRLTAGG